MTERENELVQELAFMYNKYEELCHAYKRLAKEKGLATVREVNDMSHMKFEEKGKM